MSVRDNECPAYDVNFNKTDDDFVAARKNRLETSQQTLTAQTTVLGRGLLRDSMTNDDGSCHLNQTAQKRCFESRLLLIGDARRREIIRGEEWLSGKNNVISTFSNRFCINI
jgi:hypothetical protein